MKGKVIMIVTIGIICILFTSIMFVQFKSVQVIEASGVGQKRETELRTEYSALNDKSDEMKQQLEEIEVKAKEALSLCEDSKILEELRVKFLGKKGELTGILKQMGKLSAE